MDSDSENRKRKLQEIRARAAAVSSEDSTAETAATGEQKRIKFRNYQPRDKSLAGELASQEGTTGEAKRPTHGKENRATHQLPPKVDIIAEELKKLDQNEDTINIAPRKANWDLKKHVQDKMDRLERRTQRAIIEILQEKIAAQHDSDSD